jgi:hypothetical protein
MNAIESNLRPIVSSQILGGVSVPDSPLIASAINYARENSEPYLFNHAMRSWLFGVTLAQLSQSEYDAEVLALTAILHDLGLTKAFDGPLRFEVEGANAARAFARRQGVGERRAQLIWDGIALNSTASIAFYKEAEVALCTAGVALDWGGWGFEKMTREQVAAIVDAFPRLDMKRNFTRAVCGICESRAATTYDNFARDFGERFVPGYKAVSTVDFFLDAPFAE